MKWEWAREIFSRGDRSQPSPEKWNQELEAAYDSLDVQVAVGFIHWTKIAEECDYYINHDNGCPDELRQRFEDLKQQSHDRYMDGYRDILPDEEEEMEELIPI
jgi:hypothetical protein